MAGTVNVILARDVDNLGRIGDLAAVKPGYARNYLIPQGLALPASKARVADFEHKKRVVEHQRSKLREASQKVAGELAQTEVTISARVGEQGKLFGSIGARDIAAAFAEQGHKINHRDIKMSGPVKTVGLHVFDLRLEADVTTQIKVVVAGEKVEEPEADVEEAVEAAGDIDAEGSDKAEGSEEVADANVDTDADA